MTFLSLSLRCVLILHCEYEVQSVQVRVGYKRRSVLWFYGDLPPLYTYANFPIHFNVMPFLTVFGQSQSSILTIRCEWISWIPGVQWPQFKQTGRRGPCFSADAPCRGRRPRYCFDWEWYVVGTRRRSTSVQQWRSISLFTPKTGVNVVTFKDQ